MSDQDKINRQVVLENAIQKAIDGGWDKWNGSYVSIDSNPITGELFVYFDYLGVEKPKKKSKQHSSIYGVSLCSILIDKNFAKALWEESKPIAGKEPWQTLGWEHHLKNMVLAEDPIEYLAENLD